MKKVFEKGLHNITNGKETFFCISSGWIWEDIDNIYIIDDFHSLNAVNILPKKGGWKAI